MQTSWVSRQASSNLEDVHHREFVAWLREHGAVFSCIEWPSYATGSGMRGAVARRDITTGDHMVIIPQRLMMSAHHAKAGPERGHVHRDNAKLLGNDNGLALYIMQEMLKGEDSFYWPYLRVLPRPRNLRHWSEESLRDLQNQKAMRRTTARTRHLRALYRDTMNTLSTTYPDLYPVDRYTLELFDFAWSTVQARAFGKRLKCSALVPLADCLNHANVQTKYDFDSDGCGAFRLYPSGINHYPRHAEVFNSYGRRANDNLLLDYGFAMLDNEWDTAEVVCSLLPDDFLFQRRRACLQASRQHTLRIVLVRRDVWAEELLRFNRCACLTATELDFVEADVGENGDDKEEDDEENEHAGRDVLAKGLCQALGEEFGVRCIGHASATGIIIREGEGNASSSIRQAVGNKDVNGGKSSDESGTDTGYAEVSVSHGDKNWDRGPSAADGLKQSRFPSRPLSMRNELAALTMLKTQLLEAADIFPTTLEHDQEALLEARNDDDPDLRNALTYRVTVKRILARQLEMAEQAIVVVQGGTSEKNQRDELNVPGSRHPYQPHFVLADTASGVVNDSSNGRTSTLPRSFVSYLSDVTEFVFRLEQAPGTPNARGVGDHQPTHHTSSCTIRSNTIFGETTALMSSPPLPRATTRHAHGNTLYSKTSPTCSSAEGTLCVAASDFSLSTS